MKRGWASYPEDIDEDKELFEHYVHRGATPWNVSLEAAWLDYELRAWALPQLRARSQALRVCNVGIGVGLWDDWLGHELGFSITSVDRDPDICRVFSQRQRRELHPHPACVVCGDVLDGVLGRRRYDIVTLVGSTLDESGDRQRMLAAITASLRPDGIALVAEVGQGTPPPNARTHGSLWITFSELLPSEPLRSAS